MGPYATGAILSAMGVAQRYDKVLVHHTFGIPSLAKYEHAVPGLVARLRPRQHGAATRCSTRWPPARKPPKTVAVVTSKFPSIQFMIAGAREVLKKRGLTEVLFLEWDFGNRDFGPIANRIKDAKPDFVWVGAIGLDGNLLLDAMKKIDYVPPQHFYLYPAPGPLVHAAGGEERAVGDDLRGAAAVHQRAGRGRVRQALPRARHQGQAAPTRRSRCRPPRRTPPGRSWRPASTATKSLDDKAIAAWLKANQVDTIQGKLRFDGAGNYGDDLMRIKQVQNGHWVVVWPKELHAPAAPSC